MARVTFDSIFQQHLEDGTLEPRQRMRIGGVELGPGVRFKNTFFGGINFHDPAFFGHDLEVNIDNDVTVVMGIY